MCWYNKTKYLIIFIQKQKCVKKNLYWLNSKQKKISTVIRINLLLILLIKLKKARTPKLNYKRNKINKQYTLIN